MQIESTSCCPSELCSSTKHTTVQTNLVPQHQLDPKPSPKLKQYISPSRTSKHANQSTVRKVRTSQSVLRSEYSDTVKKSKKQRKFAPHSTRSVAGQKSIKESRLVDAECQTTQLQYKKPKLQLKPCCGGRQRQSQAIPVVKLLSFRDLPPASLNTSKEFSGSRRQASKTQKGKQVGLVDCTEQLEYILQYRRGPRKTNPPKKELILQPEFMTSNERGSEEFLKKMRQYRFATHYFSEDEFFKMIQQFREAALPETKWPVLIIDRVYDKLAH